MDDFCHHLSILKIGTLSESVGAAVFRAVSLLHGLGAVGCWYFISLLCWLLLEHPLRRVVLDVSSDEKKRRTSRCTTVY